MLSHIDVRASKLRPLPGKRRIGRNAGEIARFAQDLQRRFKLPNMLSWRGTHDDLQAVVAALPAVGLLRGPCRAIARMDCPGWTHEPLERRFQLISLKVTSGTGSH